MRVTIERPPAPPTPPATVTIEMTEDEARKLRAICGNNGTACEAMYDTGEFYLRRVGIGNEKDLRSFMAQSFDALSRVVPQERDRR